MGGVLENSRICDHTEPPYGRLRKTLKYKVKYSEKMVDTASVEFKEIKLDVEKKVSATIIDVLNNCIVPCLWQQYVRIYSVYLRLT